jgi:hypothetical protein
MLLPCHSGVFLPTLQRLQSASPQESTHCFFRYMANQFILPPPLLLTQPATGRRRSGHDLGFLVPQTRSSRRRESSAQSSVPRIDFCSGPASGTARPRLAKWNFSRPSFPFLEALDGFEKQRPVTQARGTCVCVTAGCKRRYPAPRDFPFRLILRGRIPQSLHTLQNPSLLSAAERTTCKSFVDPPSTWWSCPSMYLSHPFACADTSLALMMSSILTLTFFHRIPN